MAIDLHAIFTCDQTFMSIGIEKEYITIAGIFKLKKTKQRIINTKTSECKNPELLCHHLPGISYFKLPVSIKNLFLQLQILISIKFSST